MSRSYRNVYPKKFWVYSVEDLMNLYSVTANTVSNWVGDGLTPSDNRKPYLFQGRMIQRFHAHKRGRIATSLRAGEFMCLACKRPVFPAIETVRDSSPIGLKHMYSAICPNCSGRLQKITSETDRDIVEDCRNPNTNRRCLHEEDSATPVRIGIRENCLTEGLHLHNDRTIYAWLTYAGRYDAKTIDRHLAAIRYCEDTLAGKPFGKLNRDDVAKLRDDLKRRAHTKSPNSLSASSIRHRVSHLSAFFDWLRMQDGFKSLPEDLSRYLELPKATLASAAQVKPKDYPTLDEAKELLDTMPSRSLTDQRAKAIFALAFLGALRADTLISLRIKHVDISRRLILQDASSVRAKAGKSIAIKWFPIPKCFEAAVIDWIGALSNLGFTAEDALFPEISKLRQRPVARDRMFPPVPVMSTKHAVTEAFAIACRDRKVKFTPHAAKHCIAAERDERPLTHLERKAWSENMGHENEQITERHYGKMSEDQRFEVLEHIGESAVRDFSAISDEKKIAGFDLLIKLWAEI